MVKKCPKCGGNNGDFIVICVNCGETLITTDNPQHDYKSPELLGSKHSFKKIKIAVLLVIIIILMSSLIIYFFQNFYQNSRLNLDEEKFLGIWVTRSGREYTFKHDSFSKTFLVYPFFSDDPKTYAGTWYCENEKLYLKLLIEGLDYSAEYYYAFQENQIILSSYYDDPLPHQIVLTKK